MMTDRKKDSAATEVALHPLVQWAKNRWRCFRDGHLWETWGTNYRTTHRLQHQTCSRCDKYRRHKAPPLNAATHAPGANEKPLK